MSNTPVSVPTAGYQIVINRMTIDKLGVKLYDSASAVVAELVANGYDADAEEVSVQLPLSKTLDKGNPPYTIKVRDNGHGMTPDEARAYFLVVGSDRRRRPNGARSRTKNRAVMGRKGIGKLAPFGICRRIEVLSSGGEQTAKGFLTSHFILDFDKIVTDGDGPVDLDVGKYDQTWRPVSGTIVTLSNFLGKRTPNLEIFVRQLARRFALTSPDFKIKLTDTVTDTHVDVPQFEVDIEESTRISVDERPVAHEGLELQVTGWVAFAKHSYRNEEEAGVRIYARGKIVATTRDFEQPAGFTGEFAARSYVVGEIHAEWLDSDELDDLIRTDRQAILWDSDFGNALRQWGMKLIRDVAKLAAGPRRINSATKFLIKSDIERRSEARYGPGAIHRAVMALSKQIGGFAHEDDLDDGEYVEGLAELVLSVAPHTALVESFKTIAGKADANMDDLLDLFGDTRIAEMASYAQIAAERVQAVEQLMAVIDDPSTVEGDLQKLIANAPWLIRPDWSVITENQGLKQFRNELVKIHKRRTGEDIEPAISYENKRPDFTLAQIGQRLYVVELKKPNHDFDDNDYARLENYLVALDELFEQKWVKSHFPESYVVHLIADGESVTGQTARRAFESAVRDGVVVRFTWQDFLAASNNAMASFLAARDRAIQS